MSFSSAIKIVEVGPRDGLQNEKQIVPSQTKIELIERLASCGVQHIEAAAFVSPKWVLQMADGEAVLKAVKRSASVSYSALVPNMQGLERALAASVDEVVVFTAASEAFTRKNINCSIDESLARFAPVVAAALEQGVRVRGSISCSFGCPYQGEVPVSATVELVHKLRAMGCSEVDVCDTIGVATPAAIHSVFSAVRESAGLDCISAHLHDTYGQGIANAYASVQEGVRILHSSVAGLGGCPYARGATGNIATEDLVYMLQGLGIDSGIDLDALVTTGAWISEQIGRAYGARAGRALLAKRAASAQNAAAETCVA